MDFDCKCFISLGKNDSVVIAAVVVWTPLLLIQNVLYIYAIKNVIDLTLLHFFIKYKYKNRQNIFMIYWQKIKC